MKTLLLIIISLLFISCGKNSDGSDPTTYSSCKITKSNALFSKDRQSDLSQCFNAPGNAYESKGDATAWCQREVDAYMSKRYLVGHSIEFQIESTFCKK